uniref:Nanos homolog 3 n=1 Tax=Cacopsylla melanoneura TaxID=428564 RepID=A0A8D8ZIH3_9HEMI
MSSWKSSSNSSSTWKSSPSSSSSSHYSSPGSGDDRFGGHSCSSGAGGRNNLPGCVLCFQNNKMKAVYMSHTIKDGNGHVTCPVLYKNVCPYCGATGSLAHTKNYCPQNPNKYSFKEYLKYRNASGGKYESRVMGYGKK